MKKLFLILVSMFTLSGILVAKPALSEKEILKMAKKEAKRLKKDGWTVAPGALPIEVQLQRRYTKEFDVDENEQNRYYLGTSQPTAQFFDAASIQAATLCKLDIAGQLGGKMQTIIQAELGNKQTSGVTGSEEAVSVAQVTAALTEKVQANLRDIIPLFEVMKKLPNGNVQVQRTVAYSRAMAEQVVREVVAKELENALNGLKNKLDTAK